MRRLVLNAATVLSLVLYAATLALWAWTHFAPQLDFFTTIQPGRSYGLGTERGALIGFLQRETPAYREGDAADTWLARGGFRYVRITSDGMRRWNLVLPLWALAIATAIPALARETRRRQLARRARAGLCPACGYDFRATPDRCPECGHAPAQTSN